MKILTKVTTGAVIVGSFFILSTACFASGDKFIASMQKGNFYVGATAGVNSQYFRYKATHIMSDRTAVHTADASNYKPTFGLLLGYQQLYQVFGWGVELRGIYNAGKARSEYYLAGKSGSEYYLHGVNNSYEFRMQYQADLAVKPIVKLTNDVYAYLPIGVTVSDWYSSIDQTAAVTNGATIAKDDNNEYLWGGFAGLGLEKQINKNWAVFAEYDAYVKYKESKNLTASINPINYTNVEVSSSPFQNTVKVGVKVLF